MADDTGSEPPRRPTIVDVARLANVHHSTASRALRGDKNVRAETALLVRAAAVELGYAPDPVARVLRRGSDRRPIVAVVGDEGSFTGISPNAQAFWFFLSQSLTSRMTDDRIWVIHTPLLSLSSLDSLPVDLIIVLSIIDSPIDIPANLAGTPMVLERGRNRDEAVAAVIGHDHPAIAAAACDLLADKGSRKVAFIPLSDRDTVSVNATIGYRRWCQERGVGEVVLEPGTSADDVREIVAAAVRDGVDGIYALSAQQAAVLEGIHVSGRECPADVQVVGVGAGLIEPLFHPPLTAVFLDGVGCGSATAELARRLLQGGGFESVDFPWGIIQRESTR